MKAHKKEDQWVGNHPHYPHIKKTQKKSVKTISTLSNSNQGDHDEKMMSLGFGEEDHRLLSLQSYQKDQSGQVQIEQSEDYYHNILLLEKDQLDQANKASFLEQFTLVS
jgi:hypothetical protein